MSAHVQPNNARPLTTVIFSKREGATSPTLFEIAVRLGRVEQMLADNKAMLNGGAR